MSLADSEKYLVKFNFRLHRSKASEDAEVTNTGVISKLENTNPGVTEPTMSNFVGQHNFSEKSKVTGIKAPPRGGTVTGLIAREKQRKQKLRKYLKIGAASLVPVCALLVFWLLSANNETEEIPVMPAPQIAKNPNKGKPAEASPNPEDAVPLASQGSHQSSPEAQASENSKNQLSPYATSALFSRPLSEKKAPSPAVRLPAQAQTNHVPRESAAFLLYGKEVEKLQNTLRSDEDGKRVLNEWNQIATRALSTVPQPLVTLSEGEGSNREQHERARSELNDIRILAFASAAENKKDYVERANSMILLWAKTYHPSGDAIAERWLEPLIEAYGFTSRTMKPDDRSRVDLWLTEIANKQINEAAARPGTDDLWYAHHMKLMTMIAYGLGRASFQAYVEEKFPQVLASSIHASGGSSTYESTFSMALHIEHVTALLRSAIILDRVGRAKPEFLPTPEQPLAKAIEFALPSLRNETSHIEFVLVQNPELKARQEAGDRALDKLPFDRSGATEFFDVIGYFRPSIAQIAGEALGNGKKKYATLRTAWFDSMNRNVSVYEAQPTTAKSEETTALSAQPVVQAPAPSPAQPNVAQPPQAPPGVPTQLPQRQPATPQ